MCRFYRMTFYSLIIIMICTTLIFTSQQIPEQQLYNAIKHGLLDDASAYLKRSDLNFDFIDVHDDATCLECAIKCGQAGIIHGLLQKNINVNCQYNKNRETPLHQAVYIQDESIVGLLLQHKDIDLERRDVSSLTPLQLASLLGYVKIADIIRNYKDLKIERLSNPIRSISSSERFSTFSTQVRSASNFEQTLLDEQKNKEKCLWFWWIFNCT